jgi:uncharacterized protein (TIGR02246 family)
VAQRRTAKQQLTGRTHNNRRTAAHGARLFGMTNTAVDRDAIRDLYARYCWNVDTGAADDWADCFTEDGEFIVGVGDPLVGREALLAFARSLPSGVLHHMVMNEAIDVDGDAAACRSSVLVLSNGAIVTTGRSEDVLRRVEGSWKIAHRNFTPDGK